MDTETIETPQVDSLPAWKLEKIKAKEAKLQVKIVKFGLELQFEELKEQGFTDLRQNFRALKKSKGDLIAATTFLNSMPAKGEKLCKKHLKARTASEKACEFDSQRSRKARTPSQEAQYLEKRMKKLSTGSSSEDSKPRKFKQERTPEEEILRKEKKHANAHARMQERMPQFAEFNEKMSSLGFTDAKKNFSALKKKDGKEDQAAIYLRLKLNLKNLQLRDSLSHQPFKTLYLDCNNCFYLEQSFLKKAIAGDYEVIENKIMTLMKIFQAKYGSPIRVVLVFDDSKLLINGSENITSTFLMMSARPKFNSADDLLVSLAQQATAEERDNSIFVTSDRMLQARLIDEKVNNIMASKVLFNQLKKDYVGKIEFADIIDV